MFFAKASMNDRHDARRIADVSDCGLGRPNALAAGVANDEMRTGFGSEDVRLGVGTPDATLDKSAYCEMALHG